MADNPASETRSRRRFSDATALVTALRPSYPVYCFRPHKVRAVARHFVETFPGKVVYAVKCNIEPRVLGWLAEAGVTAFDTASLTEIAAVRERLPDADALFMHPVKSRAAILAADRVYDVSTYCVDSMAELEKVLQVAKRRDLKIFVRVATPGGGAAFELSIIPAESAHIGMVSQLFSRVGASDDLARGRSTFMVEMVETAAILNQADDRALVILDEIGRGTATYDGLSIAWATLEHLHEVNRSRALFATHYHELTQLAAKLPGVDNATVSVKEWEGEVIFLHEVKKGAADRSYGVQVAQLAGLPASVVARARSVLDMLEKSSREGGGAGKVQIDDLPLFAAAPAPQPKPAKGPSPAEKLLDEIFPDDLTPREALEALYRLKDASKS